MVNIKNITFISCKCKIYIKLDVLIFPTVVDTNILIQLFFIQLLQLLQKFFVSHDQTR